jgi:fibronectin type 3 domain-containing protein
VATLVAVAAPAKAAGVLFSDGFETGNTSKWTATSGMAVQQQVVAGGTWAARATSSSAAAYVYKTLATTQDDLYVDLKFNVISSGNNNVSLMRLRTSAAGAILTMYRRADGSLYYVDEVSGASALGGQVTTGSWHELQVHSTISTGRLQVWLDGVPVTAMSRTDNLGTTPVGRVYVGEPATGRVFDVAYDNVVLSNSADFTPPTTPTGVTATAVGSNRVDVGFTGSTDDVGVAGYTVLRDGSAVATLAPSARSYSDTAVMPSTTYAYTVTAFDASGNASSPSAPASATTTALDVTPPTTPGGGSATAVDTGRVDLSWSASTDNVGVTGYAITRGGSPLTTVGPDTLTYSDTTVSASTTYSYGVIAFDAGGNRSTPATLGPVTTPDPPDTTAPSVPQGLQATAPASNRVDLTWSAATDDRGVTGYVVSRGGAVLTTTTATSYSDLTVSPSTAYTYTVQAVDAAGNTSAPSDPAPVTTPAPVDNTPPDKPTGLRAGAVSAGEVDLTWDAASSDVASFTLYRDGAVLATVPATASSYADKTVTGSTTYTYRLDAVDAAGNHSTATSPVAATTPAAVDSTPPSTPQLTATAVGPNRVDLQWPAATDDVGVTGYTVFRNAQVLVSLPATARSYSDTSVAPATGYTYTVDAVDAAGNRSDKSDPASVTTPPLPDTTPPTVPGSLGAVATSPTRVDLSWTASSDAGGVTGYTVYRGGVVLANIGAGFTGFSDGSVAHSQSYSYSVDAFDAAGNHSAQTAAVSVTTPGTVFGDGFESGNASAWTASTGLSVQKTIVHSGTWAARATSTGTATNAYRNFTPALADLYYDGWVNVQSQSSTTTLGLVRFRTASLGVVFSVLRRSDGKLSYYNEVTKVSTALGVLTTGSWHHLVVHGKIGTSGAVQILLDGISQYNKTENLGSTPIGRIYVGDTATSNTYDMVLDDETVSTSSDTNPPSTPVIAAATAVGPRHVNVTWAAASDDVAVAGYSISRNGTVVGKVGPQVLGYADFAAAAGTPQSYSVTAFDSSGNTSPSSTPVAATTGPAVATDPSVLAFGDSACDPTTAAFNGGSGTATQCHQLAVSNLAWNSSPTAVLPLGDEQYEVGSFSAFQQSYDPSWGRVGSIARPVPGNHEYLTAGGSGYYTYFGSAAGSPSSGWYSYDIGSWHVIALNGECASIGGCGAGSPQEAWLRADLAAHPSSCTLAYWHEPRWSSGWEHGSDARYSQFWQDLYSGGADVVLNGHDHDYERFAPQDPWGSPDPVHGIREFVVGTGGAELEPAGPLEANSEVFQSTSFGALQLTLHNGSYDWALLPDTGGAALDSGSESCR